MFCRHSCKLQRVIYISVLALHSQQTTLHRHKVIPNWWLPIIYLSRSFSAIDQLSFPYWSPATSSGMIHHILSESVFEKCFFIQILSSTRKHSLIFTPGLVRGFSISIPWTLWPIVGIFSSHRCDGQSLQLLPSACLGTRVPLSARTSGPETPGTPAQRRGDA